MTQYIYYTFHTYDEKMVYKTNYRYINNRRIFMSSWFNPLVVYIFSYIGKYKKKIISTLSFLRGKTLCL